MAQGVRFRKVHNLTYLLELCEEEGLLVGGLRDEVASLTPFAVDERYPGARRMPPPSLVHRLLEASERLLDQVRDQV